MRYKTILLAISLPLLITAAHCRGQTNEISAATLTNLISFLGGKDHAHAKFQRAAEILRTGARLPVNSSTLLAGVGCTTNGDTLTYSLMELDLRNEAYWIRLVVDNNRNEVLKLDWGGFQMDPQPPPAN